MPCAERSREEAKLGDLFLAGPDRMIEPDFHKRVQQFNGSIELLDISPNGMKILRILGTPNTPIQFLKHSRKRAKGMREFFVFGI